MTMRALLRGMGKLLLCGAIFSVGTVIGGQFVAAVGLPPPPMPAGMDPESAMMAMVLQSPLLALVLAPLARHLAAGFWGRSLMLFALAWISNSVNTQIEASAFYGIQAGFSYAILTFLFPILLTSMAVAWLFPPSRAAAITIKEQVWRRYDAKGWLWRLTLGAVLFMPIYFLFGSLVIPFTFDYYAQNLYGLQIPSRDTLFGVLLIRSVLFLLACLPVILAWLGTKVQLALGLGLALFYLVGFQALVIANWLPWAVRLPHMIEILFDEFVYASALTWLFGRASHSAQAPAT